MFSVTKEFPISLGIFKNHTDVFTTKPWFNSLAGFKDEQVSQVGEETKEQAACKAWHQHRAGQTTGLFTHSWKNHPKHVLKTTAKVNQLTTKSFYGARTMRWKYKYTLAPVANCHLGQVGQRLSPTFLSLPVLYVILGLIRVTYQFQIV